MANCQICKKTNRVGRNASHAMNKTPRRFKANIQKKTVVVGGLKISLKLCGKCIKRMKKDLKDKAEVKKTEQKLVSTKPVSKTKSSNDSSKSKSNPKKKVVKSKKA
ncbi:MAG: 50S ribosomal protein L28 [Patescibacteria group bacterium]